jgi:hypothetical protein
LHSVMCGRLSDNEESFVDVSNSRLEEELSIILHVSVTYACPLTPAITRMPFRL